MRSLESLLRRLEGVAGIAGVTEKEFGDAMVLLRRHGRVIASKILYETAGCEWSDPDIDPNEVALISLSGYSGATTPEELSRKVGNK